MNKIIESSIYRIKHTNGTEVEYFGMEIGHDSIENYMIANETIESVFEFTGCDEEEPGPLFIVEKHIKRIA